MRPSGRSQRRGSSSVDPSFLKVRLLTTPPERNDELDSSDSATTSGPSVRSRLS